MRSNRPASRASSPPTYPMPSQGVIIPRGSFTATVKLLGRMCRVGFRIWRLTPRSTPKTGHRSTPQNRP